MPATKQPQKRKKPLTDVYLNGLPLWKLLSIAINRYIADYHDDRAAFWRDIRKLRDDLKKAGL